MTDTPRTDALEKKHPSPREQRELCIELEQELSLATATIANQHKLITDAEQRGEYKAKQELAEAIKQRDFAKEHHRYYQQRTSDFMGANAELSDKLCAVTVERDALKTELAHYVKQGLIIKEDEAGL